MNITTTANGNELTIISRMKIESKSYPYALRRWRRISLNTDLKTIKSILSI